MIRLLAINTHSPLLNLLRLVVIFTLILIIFPFSARAESGMLFHHEQNGGGSIEDNGGDDGRTIWEIDLLGAPTDAVITSVDVEYRITHPWTGDLRVWLATEHKGEWIEYILWDLDGGSDNNIYEKETALTIWNGLPANRKWYFSAADFAEDDEGEIEECKIWVHFDSASPVTPQDSIYSQDFSLGKPSTIEGWEYYSSNQGRIKVVNGKLRMDDTTDGSVYSLNEAILHLDLSGRSGVILTLDHSSSRDENDSLPTTFTGHANGDGIAISADGINWYLLTSLTSDFQNRSFDLDAAIQPAGISYTSDFRIKFQQYDNYSWPEDGRAFDNISITTRKPEPVPVNRPFGTWKGTFESTGYRTFGTINNWILRDDYITESTWELNIGSKTGLRINPSGTYSFNPLNSHLDFSYTGLATIWVDRQIIDIPCIFDVNGTVFPDNASGNYAMRFFPPDLLPFSDSGTWQATQIPNIVLHICGIEICTGWNHNDPDKVNDMTYDFYLGVETDNTINQVEFLTPAGSIFSIPYNFHTESDNIETWHYAVGTEALDISIAHWKMDDNAATTTVVDSSGNGNHGTAQRNTTALTTSGIINTALSFNGLNDYVVVPDQDQWSYTSDFTISMWVKFNKFNLKWWEAAFIAQDQGPGGKNKWIFSYNPTEKKTIFHINGPSPGYPWGGYVINGNPWIAETEVWYFVAVSRKGNVYTFYRQGDPDGIVVNTIQIPNVAAPLTIGWAEGSRTFDGALDDVRIFNKALSETEVKAMYDRKSKDTERWEYLGKLTNQDALKNYGDGTYTITAHHKDGRQSQTTAWFGIPETHNAIPQPIKKPVLIFPENNGKATSPVTFMWEPYNDIKATSIGLCVEKVGFHEGCIIDNDFPISATSSNPISLGTGIWQAELFWDRWYNYNNPDGISVEVGKFSESDYRFEISEISPDIPDIPDTAILNAHWKMNDNAATTTVLDSSGNGNHGTAQHQTSAMTAAGIIDSSLRFNGINDYIRIPKGSNLITGTNDFTIAGWCSLNAINSIQNLIAWKEPYSAVQFVITDGMGNTGIWAGSKWLMSIGYTFTTGTWNHIAWTKNGNTWKVYVNGTQIGLDVIDSSSLGMPILDYHIGAEATAPSQFLNGLLDDVRIYNKALSGTEVKAIYGGQEVDNTQQPGDKEQPTDSSGQIVIVEPGQGELIEQQIIPVKPEKTEEEENDTTIIVFPIPETP